MENNFWKNPKDVLDDFELLSDFYDPNAQIKWNITKNLPRSTRGRGTKIVDSDTDEDENDDLSLNGLNYNQEDLKEIDSVREYEVQDALRRACGVGHSNHAIESHWRAGTRDIPESEKENSVQNVENHLDSKKIENTKQNVNSKPESSNDEKENALKLTKVVNEDSNSHSNTEVRRNGLSRRTTYVRRPNTEIEDHQVSSQASSQTSSQEEDIVVHSAEISTKEKPIDDLNNIYEYYSDSSDENIILESHDLDDITNLFANLNNNTNDKRKTNRKKYKAVDIDVKLPTQTSTLIHNEYTKIPTKPTSFTEALTVQSVLNPNAKEFYSSFSYNRDDRYKLGSEKDFPPLS